MYLYIKRRLDTCNSSQNRNTDGVVINRRKSLTPILLTVVVATISSNPAITVLLIDRFFLQKLHVRPIVGLWLERYHTAMSGIQCNSGFGD